MAYSYNKEKQYVFSEEGQKTFLKIRDRANYLLRESGAFRVQELLKDVCGSAWPHLACVDRLKELGEIKELTDINEMGQYRVFIKNT